MPGNAVKHFLDVGRKDVMIMINEYNKKIDEQPIKGA